MVRSRIYDANGKLLGIRRTPDRPDTPKWKTDGDFRELKVWICVGCFNGNLRFPLTHPSGEWKDQGIDLFDDHPTTRKIHQCSGEKYPPAHRGLRPLSGDWQEEVLRLPLEIWEKLTSMEGVEPGPMTIDPNHGRD